MVLGSSAARKIAGGPGMYAVQHKNTGIGYDIPRIPLMSWSIPYMMAQFVHGSSDFPYMFRQKTCICWPFLHDLRQFLNRSWPDP